MRSVLSMVLLMCCVSASHAQVAVKSLDFTIHQEYTSTRALAMGNAFTAVADDHSAMFYNPALLAWRNDGQLRMFIRAGTTPKSLKLFEELDKAETAAEYNDFLVENYGEHFYYRVPTIGAVWVRPGWGIAVIPADLSLDAAVNRQIGPTLNVNAYLDSTIAFSHATKLKWFNKRHQLSWGATIKAIHRVYIGEAISSTQFATGSEVWDTSHANEGLTVDLDLGLFWKPPAPGFLRYMEPSFALVGRNLADYGFTTNFHILNENSGQPPNLQRRMDVGTKFDLPDFWVFDPHIAADLRDIGHENFSMTKGSHAGLEVYWKLFNWWKGYWSVGINQKYLTYGLGARLAWFNIDACSFGEEVGTDDARQESRRYMVEMSLDF